MDFIIRLPLTLGKFDSICVIVDGLTKTMHYLPRKENHNTKKLINIYIR